MSTNIISTAPLLEAKRQIEICNACRYCEGFCSAFPAITRLREFDNADITQIANLCHNCRGCYYSCQYTAPHEFDLNLPQALAQVRNESWQEFIWPRALGRVFQKHAWGTIALTVLGFALIFAAMKAIGTQAGEGFYALLSHSVMVAIFMPTFLLPLISLVFGLRGYWKAVGGKPIKTAQIIEALKDAASTKNLSGGHGEGCNFEKEDRYTSARRYAHHAIMYGFLLCFASTSVATLMHYLMDMQAPYGPFSLPKLLGVPGGILLSIGCAWMLYLKAKADRDLSDETTHSAETAFVALLGFVAVTGLGLYWLGDTLFLPVLLAIHLGAVLSFFLLTPYTKMAHGFFRLAALIHDAQLK